MIPEMPSLRRSFSWMLVGNILYAACLWGIVSLLTKLGSPEALGRYALATAVATPLIIFANLQLRPILATDCEDQYAFSEYLALRLICLPAALLVVALISICLYSGAQLAAILLFACLRVLDGLSDIVHGYVQRYERLDIMATSLALKGIGSLALFTALFLLTGDLLPALAGQAAAGGLVFLVWDLPRIKGVMKTATGTVSLKPHWNMGRLRTLAWTSLPLGLAMLFIQLRNTIPRMILENERGEAELGLFAAMAYLIIIGNTVVMALSQSSLARLARAYAVDDAQSFLGVVKKLISVGAVLGAGGLLVALLGGEKLLTLIYTEDYARQGGVFIIIMLAGGLYYVGTMLGPAATASGAYREQLAIQGAHALVLLVLGFLLIPAHGMLGAAWTMVAGALLVTASYGVVTWRAVRRMKARSAT